MTEKRMISTVFTIGLLCLSALLIFNAAADVEPNDDFSEAERISAGTYPGTLNDTSDYQDYYEFGISHGDRIKVDLTSSSNDLMMYLYDGDEGPLAEVAGSSSGISSINYLTAYETEYSTCYLLLETQESSVSYSFTLTLTPQNDGGSEMDAPADRNQGIIVEPGAIYGEINDGEEGYSMGGEDHKDCYRFWAGSGDRIRVSFTAHSEDDLYLEMLDPDENYVFWEMGSKQENTVTDEYWTANETEMGWWYIEVWQDAAPGNYEIILDIERQNESGSGGDAPANYLSALAVEPGTINGHVEDEDYQDAFKFQAGNGDVISVDFRGYSVEDHLYIDLLDSEGGVIKSNRSSTADTGVAFFYHTANETALQNFHLIVWMDTQPGNYVLTLSVFKQDDAGSGVDAPGNSGTLIVLEEGSYEGSIYDLDTSDMYTINLTGGDILRITLTVQEVGPITMALLKSNLIDYVFGNEATLGSPVLVNHYFDGALEPDLYYLRISNGQGHYGLDIVISRQNDAASDTDAPGSTSPTQLVNGPIPIAAGNYFGFLHTGADTIDAYLLNVTGGKRVNVTIEPDPTLGIGAFLLGEEGETLSSDTLNPLGGAVYIQHDFTSAGSAQLILSLEQGSGGSYSFMVTVTDIPAPQGTPSAPVLTAAPGQNKVILTWSAPSSDGGSPIAGYRIYRGTTAAGPLTLLNTITSGQLTYEDSSVVAGSNYYYEVAAFNPNGEGVRSNRVMSYPQGQSDEDTDGDGIPDWWEIQYELNPGDASDAGEDPDGDGRTNLQEYLDGTNPRVYDQPANGGGNNGGGNGPIDDTPDFPWWIVGICCSVSFLGLIVLLIIIFVVAASRKKKKGKEDEE